jgi:hypothetical protein
MSEEQVTIEQLENDGIVAAIRWVFEWVFWRVNKDFDPSAGHNQTVVGVLAFTYACDLFNRLAAAGRYRLPEGAAGDRGLDILRDGIPSEAFEAMLNLDVSRIRRNDFMGSPGWSVGNVRWILQSMPYGGVDKINWNDKSDTKQSAGRQPYSYGNPGLFELEQYDLASEIDPGFSGTTFVLAHSFNGETGEYEAFMGRSRAADQLGASPWHWRRRVASGGFGPTDPPEDGDRGWLPGTPPVPIAPDASVRIRSHSVGTGTGGE